MIANAGLQKSILLFSNPNVPSTKNSIQNIKVVWMMEKSWSPRNIDVSWTEGRVPISCITSIDNDHIGILYERKSGPI